MSSRALAHLHKFKGTLALLSEQKNYVEAENHFKQALQLFYKVNSSTGRAICRLALVRIQCEREITQDGGIKDVNNLISVTEKAKEQFTSLSYKLGEDRAQKYIDFLKQRETGNGNANLIKFVKFKTFKKDHIEQIKSTLNMIKEELLNNEDIKLF